jgi:hypothetical protein
MPTTLKVPQPEPGVTQLRSTDEKNFDFLNFGMNNFTKTVDFAIGGQMGIGPKIHNLDAATPQVYRNSVIVVTHTPTMFNNLPGGEDYKRLIQYLIETYAQAVSGLDFSYTLEEGQMPVGYDGQNLPVPTQSKRSQPSPSFTFTELLGGLIYKFFNFWMKCIQDPDTNISLASSLLQGNQVSDEYKHPPITSSWSMSFMAIQPDTTMRPENIIDAAFYTAAFPVSTGEIGFNKAVGQTALKERSVEFRALVQHNTNTMYYGRQLMEILEFHKLDYSFSHVRGAIDTAIVGSGLKKELDTATTEFADNRNTIKNTTPTTY